GITLPPGGTASGDLTGTYPNPTVAANAITSTKINDGAVGNTKIADGAVGATKLAADAVVTAKIADGAVNANKLATDAVTSTKIADDAVTTAKIIDGSITAAKLATGLSLPPNGSATGDLDGNYPAPSVSKLKGIGLSATAPVSGEVLTFDGTVWAPAPGGINLPYSKTVNIATRALHITNDGDGSPIEGSSNSLADNAAGVVGTILHTDAGLEAAGVKGVNNGSAALATSFGVLGIHNGYGVGVRGFAGTGTGVEAFSTDGFGIYAKSVNSTAAFVEVADPSANADAMSIVHQGTGIGLTSLSYGGHGMFAAAMDFYKAGLMAVNYGNGEAINAYTASDDNATITAANDGLNAALKGTNNAPGGKGIHAVATSTAGVGAGTALVAELVGDPEGDVAVFKAGGNNVARIAADGTGYFNGGVLSSGADVAELFDVEGARSAYEAGDVLVISGSTDRMVAKSAEPYSTLVAGVYATKPGLMLTEKDAHKSLLDKMVPMGVIGVIPTKVCLEGGAIKRGDLLVTSSIPGVAMKADLNKVRVGQVLGKALQDYNAGSVGKINVLVSVK
ncbi:MAG: hypothetical protein ACTHMC_08420, partial [Pseudobacter sp.]|uniref:hypothetical protein n=1 Tax=Pseudobacter sp. TaxID=2045420 RepID=UPI003F810F3B